MSAFGRSATLVDGSAARLQLAWLAGLLEAEGTFLSPPPSEPSSPRLACQMTDRDVVERVAAMFATTTKAVPRGRFRTLYVTTLKGARAVHLMRDLEPLMGDRRAQKITGIVAGYVPPVRKLDFAKAKRIRAMRAHGATISHLARTFSVARPTIRQVLDRSIYAAPPPTSWRDSSLASKPEAGHMSAPELHWLAGWLEGEGSFCRPPPSDLRRPRIHGSTRDEDVAREVGRLLRVTPLLTHDARSRERGWSPTWQLLRRGQPAVELMKTLHPLLGARRQGQIESALSAVR